eukprot:106212_1
MASMTSDHKFLAQLLQESAFIGSDASRRAAAQKQLEDFNTQSGFKNALLTICCSPEVYPDVETRLLAAITLKNSIERLWSHRSAKGMRLTFGNSKSVQLKNARPPMNVQEKESVKQRLLEYIPCEQNDRISLQLAVAVAKIARSDWPNNWSALFPSLVRAVQSQNPLSSNRGLLTLSEVVQELASRRLLSGRQALIQAANELLGFVRSVWSGRMKAFIDVKFSSDQAPSPELCRLCKEVEICSEIMFNLLSHGCPLPNEHAEARAYFPEVLQALEILNERILKSVDGAGKNAFVYEKVSEIISILSRTALKLQQNAPIPFRIFLQPFLEYFAKIVLSYKFEPHVPVNLVVNSLTFLQKVVTCKQYIGRQRGASLTPSGKIEFDTVGLSEAQAALNEFFTAERTVQIARTLLQVYFPLRPEDIELWQSDPEEFYEDSLMETASEKIRPSAESLFMGLLAQFTPIVSPFVTESLAQCLKAGPLTPGSPSMNQSSPAYQSLIARDAVYLAAGLGWYELRDSFMAASFSFPQWFQASLVPEIERSTGGVGVILRRRVAWLIGKFEESVTVEIRPACYHILLNLLNDQDLLVRLDAANSLRGLADSVNFEVEQFRSYVRPSLELLLKLVSDLSELDTRRRTMGHAKFLVNRLEEEVVPAADIVLVNLEKVWKESEQQNVLRLEIIDCLTGLVAALSVDSQKIHGFLIEVLRISTNPTSEETSYLTEQGFELWLKVLQNTPVLTSELLALFPNWIAHTKDSILFVATGMKILESYILLGGADFLQMHGEAISSILQASLTTLIDEGTLKVAEVVATLTDMFPAECPRFCAPLLAHMATELVTRHANVRGTGVKLLNEFLHVFARLAFQNYSGFLEFLANLSKTQNQNVEELILRIWIDRFDSIALPFRRRLSALALCNFLASRSPAVLRLVLPAAFSFITSVLFMEHNDEGDAIFPQYDPNPDRSLWTEIDRRQNLAKIDPAPQLNIAEYLNEKLKRCSELNGEQNIQQLVASMDQSIIQQFQQAPKKAVSFMGSTNELS